MPAKSYTPQEVMALVERAMPEEKSVWRLIQTEPFDWSRGWTACRTAFLEAIKKELGLT